MKLTDPHYRVTSDQSQGTQSWLKTSGTVPVGTGAGRHPCSVRGFNPRSIVNQHSRGLNILRGSFLAREFREIVARVLAAPWVATEYAAFDKIIDVALRGWN